VAVAGDTIVFASALSGQTITLTIGPLVVNKSLTIDGSSLMSRVKVFGNNQRNIFIVTGSNLTVTFTALDILNGLAASTGYGGGIYISAGNTTVNLNTVTMSGNRAPGSRGGAVFASGNTVTLNVQDCAFSDNGGTSQTIGGAIFVEGSAMTTNIQNSAFYYNGLGSSSEGGAIWNRGDLTVTDSIFFYNAVTVSNSSVGGAIFNYNNGGGITRITGSTFVGNVNKGGGYGGALFNVVGTTYVTNSTFTANGLNGPGAAIYTNSGPLYLTNVTVAGNNGTAGGFYNNGTAFVYNSIFANTNGSPDCIGGGFAANLGNLIETRSGCSAPVITADPLLGPLVYNGGPTPTMALLTGSPAIDAGNNPNCTAADQRGVTRPQNLTCDMGAFEVDNTPPSVAVTTAASDPTNAPFTVTVTFSEAVSGFELADLVVGNGTVGEFSGSGAVYTALITPDADGLVTVDVPADAAQDAAGNGSTEAEQFSLTYDGTAPGVVVTTTASDPTNAPFTVTVTFSEAVSGFELADLVVGNGTVGEFSGLGAVYTALITPDADGLVTVDVPADAAQDAAGNGNTEAEQFSLTYDGTAPGVVVTTTASDPTNAPFTVTVTFSEAVSGFELADLVVGNGTAGDFSGSGAVYTALITPDAEGLVTVDVPADAAQDAAGNGSTAAEQFSITYDTSDPSVAVTSSAPDPTNTSPIPVTITFSKAVSGFELADLVVGNGAAGDFSGSGAVYSATITPDADGAVTVDIAAGAAVDGAGNESTAAAQFTIVYDSTAPTAAMDPLPSRPPRTFTIAWSGTDALSGVAAFEVQVQEDGGAWTTWQASTTLTSAQFTGEYGILYGFRVRAVDEAGNVGDWSPTVETYVYHSTYLPIIIKD
jgi:hypothetical protein